MRRGEPVADAPFHQRTTAATRGLDTGVRSEEAEEWELKLDKFSLDAVLVSVSI